MKSISRYAAAALAAIALQGCAGAAGRGASDEGAAPTAVAAASADTSNVVRVEDVKKGTVLTGGLGGGVKLHGFWHPAPLPLPPGEWEVVERKDFSRTWKTAPTKPTLKFLWIALQNRDAKAHAQWLEVSSNIDTDRVGFQNNDCFGDYEVVNDFGTTASGFMQRCGYATYVEDHRPPMTFLGPPLRNPDIQSPNVIEVRLQANRGSARLTK